MLSRFRLGAVHRSLEVSINSWNTYMLQMRKIKVRKRIWHVEHRTANKKVAPGLRKSSHQSSLLFQHATSYTRTAWEKDLRCLPGTSNSTCPKVTPSWGKKKNLVPIQCSHSLYMTSLVAQEKTQVILTLLLTLTSSQLMILSIVIFKLCVSLISSLLSKPSATTLDPSHYHYLRRQQKWLTTWSHIHSGQFSPISS